MQNNNNKNRIKSRIKDVDTQSIFEKVGEKLLWNTRFIVVLGVFCSVLSAVSLFILGSYEIIYAIIKKNPITNSEFKNEDYDMLSLLITGIDLYLIGVVLLIFGFGIYELFISKIDIAREDEAVTILEIENLEELKNKIIKVIIMVLIVSFFERILRIADGFTQPIDMLYFALSIFALSLGVYFIKKHN